MSLSLDRAHQPISSPPHGHAGRYCECGARLGMTLSGRRNRRGFKPRRGHDLCQRCWRALKDRARAKASGGKPFEALARRAGT